MPGALIPPWFVTEAPGVVEMNVASIIWGVSIASALFTFAKASQQTISVWRRAKRVNAYVVMVWLEWMASSTIGVISWFYLWGSIPPGFGFFFGIITVWVFQIQCVIHIIINRIGLLMHDRRRVRNLHIIIGLILALVNVSVYCIWVPARLQISETFINVNEIWDRIEKAIFAVLDAALNIYFIYLVRSRLISFGLTKYTRLFRFNLVMIAISMSLDVILIGVMSLGKGFVYVQFHPLVYILKLYIELNMADLIAKVVRAENGGSYGSGSGNKSKSHGLGIPTDPRGVRLATIVTVGRADPNGEDYDEENGPKEGGIQKTVETEIRHEDDNQSSSSTTELQKHYQVV
ncbi:hypothetical protein GGR52DRAFT_587237 [Hypoxylon sp. FL1284]|nr:hypothetical protein GGR52DRAFT_587237 [Hypoxylon sp. FL1284]